ncbi:MAG: RsfS/YbeB/iojap family protein, partial [Maribacter dokdonensis]
MQENKTSADELIALIIQGVDEVKGQNVNLLDLREIENTVCDYFIVCNGTSNTHVNAIVGSIQKTVS